MIAEKHLLTATDSHKIFVRKWSNPDQPPVAAIHINHGMAEHSQRYQPIAEILLEAGFVVYAHDHRGHGHSIPPGGLVGHYADRNGWDLVVSDVHTVNQFIRQENPEIPTILLGHSMGSFIAQAYCLKHGDTVDAVILSGSAYSTPRSLQPPKLLIKLEKLRGGDKGRSELIDRQAFSKFNRQFGKPRTDADWLTRDVEEVDRYMLDPLCGFLCTNKMWEDFVGGLETISRSSSLRRIPSHLPFYLTSGERDPISFRTTQHGVAKLANHLKSGGQTDVTFKLYKDGRHEILNEINRREVVQDIIYWINSRLRESIHSKKPEAALA
ncbi:MAG: lysophospholipase [Ketobacter sp.]